MAQIKNEKEYETIMARIEELLPLTWGDDVAEDAPCCIELNLLAEMAADYEEEHHPFPPPTVALSEAIRESLHRQHLSQKAAAELLGISAPHLSEIVRGKTEPSLAVARNISRKLHIEPAVVLGV